MVTDQGDFEERDLDNTDRLPILADVPFDSDEEQDDAVPLQPAVADTGKFVVAADRPGVDLASLTDSLRAVEQRIAQQSVDYTALTRLYEIAREAETRALERAKQSRAEIERLETEITALRDALVSRDAMVVEALQSLREREQELAPLRQEALQREQGVAAEARTRELAGAELGALRSRNEELQTALKAAEAQLAQLSATRQRLDAEMHATRAHGEVSHGRAVSFLEKLRTREWRRGFQETVVSELDARAGAAEASAATLRGELSEVREQLRAHQAVIAQLRQELLEQTQLAQRQAAQLQERARELAALQAQHTAALAEGSELRGALEQRQDSLATAQIALTAAEGRQVELQAQVAQLQSAAAGRDEEMGVLMAHLQEARRPLSAMEGDVRAAREQLAASDALVRQLEDAGRTLREQLERAQLTIGEQEGRIRHLERSESHQADALGRIQTSMERLGVAPAGAAPEPEWAPELVRVDNQLNTVYPLTKRTRIGRASGSEVHIEASSVSRHHALIMTSARDAIIEDLNSTNGVTVNGRKVSRAFLADGDLIVIGEVHFRFAASRGKLA